VKKLLLMSLATAPILCQPNFVLIGPPGSGKGTFSFFMIQKKGFKQICLGDIIRMHKKGDTEIGKYIAANNGFVDDELAYRIIGDEVASAVEAKHRFIIDGFPRNVPAYEFLMKLFADKGISSTVTFVHFDIDDQTCINRIDSRLVCFGCSAVFNTSTKVPKEAMICDDCTSPLEVRDGDTVAATIKRLAYYREHTEPLLKSAKNDFKVVTVNAKAPVDDCISTYEMLVSE
jgi:adenylate kinase